MADTKVGNYFHSLYDLLWEVISVQLGHDFALLPGYSMRESGIEYDSCSENAECGVSRVVGKALGKTRGQKLLEGWVI